MQRKISATLVGIILTALASLVLVGCGAGGASSSGGNGGGNGGGGQDIPAHWSGISVTGNTVAALVREDNGRALNGVQHLAGGSEGTVVFTLPANPGSEVTVRPMIWEDANHNGVLDSGEPVHWAWVFGGVYGRPGAVERCFAWGSLLPEVGTTWYVIEDIGGGNLVPTDLAERINVIDASVMSSER